MTGVDGAPLADEEHARAGVPSVDGVLAGRHVSAGAYLAGLMAAAEVETVGRVDRLPRDLFPEADPVLVQAVWDRACVVVWRAAERYFAARQDPQVLRELQAGLEAAAYHAMAGLVCDAVRVSRRAGAVHPAEHPADGRFEREHGSV